MTTKLSAPRLRVVVENDDDQLVEYTIQTDNRDAVRYDLMAPRKNWPGGQQAPVLWMTVQAWSALKRSGELSPAMAKDVDAFMDACLEVKPLNRDDQPLAVDDRGRPMEDGVSADPSQKAPEPG